MAGPQNEEFEEDPEAVKVRLKALVHHYADGNRTQFAEDINVEYKALHAAMQSGALSKVIAFRIIRKYPPLSLDWLWRGDTDNQAPALTRQLEAAIRAVSTKPVRRKAS